MPKALRDAWSGRISVAKAMLLYGLGVTSGLALTQFSPRFDYVMQFVILGWIIVSLKITWAASRRSGHGYVGATAILISQSILNSVSVIVIAGVSLMVTSRMDPGGPAAYANRSGQHDKAVDRMSLEYGIEFPEDYGIRHVSSWRYGEEFGVDLVIEVPSEELRRWMSKVRPFDEPFEKSIQSNFPQFSVEWLCIPPPQGQEWRKDLVIDDLQVSAAVCGLLRRPRAVNWTSREVRIDWLVQITVFEDERLIWFHEVET